MGAGECYWVVQDLPTTFHESPGINPDNGQKVQGEGVTDVSVSMVTIRCVQHGSRTPSGIRSFLCDNSRSVTLKSLVLWPHGEKASHRTPDTTPHDARDEYDRVHFEIRHTNTSNRFSRPPSLLDSRRLQHSEQKTGSQG